LSTPSGKRCFCLSRGSELSSLPRLRILGTFASGLSSRLLASVSRTCKCRVIRTERGTVLAADDQAHLRSPRSTLSGSRTTGSWHSRRPPLPGSRRKQSSCISQCRLCPRFTVAPKITQCPYPVTVHSVGKRYVSLKSATCEPDEFGISLA